MLLQEDLHINVFLYIYIFLGRPASRRGEPTSSFVEGDPARGGLTRADSLGQPRY